MELSECLLSQQSLPLFLLGISIPFPSLLIVFPAQSILVQPLLLLGGHPINLLKTEVNSRRKTRRKKGKKTRKRMKTKGRIKRKKRTTKEGKRGRRRRWYLILPPRQLPPSILWVYQHHHRNQLPLQPPHHLHLHLPHLCGWK